jgi:2-polyprenyl-3-methyl-5-hydroxy-6-metoxy-1,4-benzoquinol methylase
MSILRTAFVRRVVGEPSAYRLLLYRNALVSRFVPEWIAVPLRPYRKLEACPSDHRKGRWDDLESIQEFAHNSVIAGYYARLRPHGSILDLGCGSGLMQRTLLPYKYSRYLGIDISPDAIKRASVSLEACAPYPDTIFQIGNMEQPLEWNGAPFDVIIINESLYYAEKPVQVLSRLYEEVLAPDGIFIISMYHSLTSQRLWRLLARRGWRPTDVTTVGNKVGVTWTIGVFVMNTHKEDGNAP